MSTVQRPVLKAFLSLTPAPSKESTSPPSSRPSSLRGLALEPTVPNTPTREHRGSSSSISSVNSDIGENGFLVLTPPSGGFEDQKVLNKIVEEDAVEA